MDLLNTYERLGTQEIEEYIRLEQEEHLHLEFKTVETSDLNKRDDRKNFAICISGFANSDGGLIIWGVHARKNKQMIDCATAAKEIDSIKQFVTKLNEFTGQAVSPIIGGIRHKPLETSSGKGFAVTLVPESASGPHMAKLGEDRYYKRSGDSFYVMEHFDLEDMFGRRQKPKLQFDAVQITEDGADEGLEFRIQNVGRGIAKYVGFFCRIDKY
jgi:predicted HTH transcriptional regulator